MKSRNYWTKERCKEEAFKYLSADDLKLNNNYVYVKCFKNNWLIEFYDNFNKRDIIWTKERCKEEALKYKTRTEFKNNSYHAYKYSLLNFWIDDICSHMPIIGNMYKRCIYAFEFTDKYVYIGLTYNIDKRSESHYKDSNSQVNKHMMSTKLEPKIIKLTDYIDVEIAKEKEFEYIELYKNMGWYILNIQKAGNTGGIKKITEELCREEISKYTSLNLFRNEKPNIYSNVIRNGWKYLLSDLDRNSKVKGYWTKEKCIEISIKYSYRIDFFKNDSNVYNISRKKGWLDEICSHMNSKRRSL